MIEAEQELIEAVMEGDYDRMKDLLLIPGENTLLEFGIIIAFFTKLDMIQSSQFRTAWTYSSNRYQSQCPR